MSWRKDDSEVKPSAARQRTRLAKCRRLKVCVRCGSPVTKNPKTKRPYSACVACRERHSQIQYAIRRNAMTGQTISEWSERCAKHFQ